MSALPVAPYLLELGAAAESGIPPTDLAEDEAVQSFSDLMADDWMAKVEAAYSRGVEHGQAALDARLEAARRQFDERLAVERRAWAREEGERLGEAIATGLKALEERIAETAARIIEPFVIAAVRARAVAELQARLADLLATNEKLALAISGPEDLLEGLRSGLAGKGHTATCTPSASCEVRIAAAQTVIETCLSGWLGSIKEAMQ